MELEEFRQMFVKAPEKFPAGLAERYPRLLKQLLAKWENPREMESYLNELVVDQRGNRQGFPQDILKEILFIAALFEKWRAERKRKAPAAVLEKISPTLVAEIEKKQAALSDDLIRQLRMLKAKLQRDEPDSLGDIAAMVNQRDKDGMTLLMHASCFGSEKCMIHLLKVGANPHMADPAGNTSLHWAVTMNRLRAAEILLYFGADPNRKNAAGVVPLFLAVIKQDPTIAGRLTDYGAEINDPDARGDFPLHKAVMAGSAEGVRVLLYAGANKDIGNRDGKRPLDLNTSTNADEVLRVFNAHQNEMLRNSMSGDKRG